MDHLDTSSDRSKATADGAQQRDRNTNQRLTIVAYCTASYSAAAIYFTAWAYAASHDPWLTPRLTHYMTVWREIGGPMAEVMVCLTLVGAMMIFVSDECLRPAVVAPLMLTFSLLLLGGIP